MFVPVNLDLAEGLDSAQVRIAYDPALLRLDGVRKGNLTQGFSTLVYHDDNGVVTVDMSGTPLGAGTGSILELGFTALASGRAAIDLQSVRLNEGNLVLTPMPVPGPDATDGAVTIAAARSVPDRAASMFRVGRDLALDHGSGDPGTGSMVDWNLRLGESFLGRNIGASARSVAGNKWVKDFVSDQGRKSAVSPNASMRITLPVQSVTPWPVVRDK